MKKEDKVSRLKERKWAREKRQRWRKREMKRREKLISAAENEVDVVVDPGYPDAVVILSAAKKGEAAENILPPEGVWMPAWWVGLPKILRVIAWPAAWLHIRYLKWKYPPTYIKSEGGDVK